jgi:hypothetical protein
MNQFRRKRRKLIDLVLSPAVFNRYVLAFDIAYLFEALTKGTQALCPPKLRNPITGIVGCCAHAASGHATAAPPSSVTNSRRLMPNMGAPSQVPLAIIAGRNRSAQAVCRIWEPAGGRGSQSLAQT